MAIPKKKIDVLISVCKPHYHYPGCSRAAMMGRQSIQGIFPTVYPIYFTWVESGKTSVDE